MSSVVETVLELTAGSQRANASVTTPTAANPAARRALSDGRNVVAGDHSRRFQCRRSRRPERTP